MVKVYYTRKTKMYRIGWPDAKTERGMEPWIEQYNTKQAATWRLQALLALGAPLITHEVWREFTSSLSVAKMDGLIGDEVASVLSAMIHGDYDFTKPPGKE